MVFLLQIFLAIIINFYKQKFKKRQVFANFYFFYAYLYKDYN